MHTNADTEAESSKGTRDVLIGPRYIETRVGVLDPIFLHFASARKHLIGAMAYVQGPMARINTK